MAESISLPSEVSTTESSSSINQCLNTDDHSWMPLEFSVNSSQEKDSSNLQVQDDNVKMVEDGPFSTGGRDNFPWISNSDFSPDNLKSMPTESSAILSLVERPSSSLEDQHEKIKSIDPARISGDDSCTPIEESSTPSFEEKVARFIQHGHLDMIHDESADEESKEFVQPQNLIVPHGLQHSEAVLNEGNAAVALNGSMSTSKQVSPSATITHPLREDLLSSEGLMTAQLDKDLDAESGKRKKQAEINCLKFMLHQKELELSQLKEQIGMEKLALSDLQTKAETEISRAQKLISEKDAELNAAEESLSGLEEVEIQYCGDGEIVEVSGSFNGWHHRVKMDLQLSSSVLEPMTSRS
ncbi:hypothetical protein CJ030_MR0G003374 [Morella rubra]|nr:hypothetical protein CJ030_MR0G003374 [Morella rubra]